MKIGILTLPLHTNYGGILQAYALQTVLERMGHEVVILDKSPYKKEFWIIWPLSICKRLIKKYLLNEQVQIFREYEWNKNYPIISQNTQLFINEYIHRREVNNLVTIQPNDFETYIVGSDQIWRPRYYSKIENAFLSFTRNWNVKRIAYATSFGTDKWEYSIQQTRHCSELVKKFNMLTVREDSGVVMCKKYLNTNAHHVLDPTMLLDKEDYIQLIKKANPPKSKGTILNYLLDESPEKEKLVTKIAKEKGLIPFRVNSRVENLFAPIEERIQPSIEQWLRGFYDAEFIITDSFHACVFSIIFNKSFLVIGNKERGLARFESLLKMFGLENRLISIEDDIKNIQDINWQNITMKLKKLKYESMLFINNIH